MSGTRKMSKFELDEFVRSRLEAAHAEPGDSSGEGQEWIPPQASEPRVAREEGSWGDFENVDLPSPMFTPIKEGDADVDAERGEDVVNANGVVAGEAPEREHEPREQHEKATTRARRFSSPPYETPPYEAAVDPPPVRVRRVSAPPSESAVHHPPVRPPSASRPSLEPEERASVEVDPDAATPMDVEALRTALSRKFSTLADKVTEAFAEFAIGAGAWSVELTAPAGMSTGGGKQALQHLMLRPKRQGYQVLVGGLVNGVDKRAELRDYDHIAMVHEVRFRARLQITANEWEQLLRKAEVVLNAAGIQSQRVPPTRDLIAHSKRKPRVSKVAIAAFVIVAVLALVVGWRVLVALGV